MKFYRLYSGDDDQSHFQELDSSRSSEFFNATRSAKSLLFRNDFAPHIVDWHRAPRRRWVITLSGTVDIGLGDGSSITFGPGDVFLAEDVTGQAIEPHLTIGLELTWTFKEPHPAKAQASPTPISH
jgi:hypothetical protein